MRVKERAGTVLLGVICCSRVLLDSVFSASVSPDKDGDESSGLVGRFEISYRTPFAIERAMFHGLKDVADEQKRLGNPSGMSDMCLQGHVPGCMYSIADPNSPFPELVQAHAKARGESNTGMSSNWLLFRNGV